MRFFAAIVLIAAVATAEPIKHPHVASIIEHLLEAIAALKPESVAVGPAIIDTEPISVGPAIVESEYEPISVGPAIVDFPLPDGGAVSESVVAPSPVAIIDGPADVSASSPLVQIIVNINQAEASPIGVSPVDVIAPEIKPEPVQVVETAPEPVQVVEIAPVMPVHPIGIVAPEPSPISPPIAVHPIGVVAPEAVEPVQIGVPVIPEAAVVLPEELN